MPSPPIYRRKRLSKTTTKSEWKDDAMKDLLGLMGKAKEMQAKFQAMQEEMQNLEASGQAGGGLVNVTLSGKFDMKALKIDPSLFKESEVEILEDLLLAAHNEAKKKLEQQIQEKTQALTAGRCRLA
jgi:DNA-binding YbaB/EbfC family protein